MAEPGMGSTRNGTAKAGKKRSWPKRIALAMALVMLVGVLGVAGLVVYGYTTTTRPNANADFQTATTFVYYNNGKSQLGSFAIQNRQPLTFEEIPDDVKEAVVAAENRDFWTDQGISIRGMFRSAWAILRGGELQGGSTVTGAMQVAATEALPDSTDTSMQLSTFIDQSTIEFQNPDGTTSGAAQLCQTWTLFLERATTVEHFVLMDVQLVGGTPDPC